MDLRKDLETGGDMVTRIEMVRSQLETLRGLLRGPDMAQARTAADDLDKKFTEVEDKLIQRKLTGQGQDDTRWPSRLIRKITYLAGGLASSDFPPTTQQREVDALLKVQLTTTRGEFDQLVSKDLADFNRMLRERNIPNVIGGGQ